MQACELCGENHDPIHCPYFVNTYTYNLAWGDHQNLSWNYNNYAFEPWYFQPQEEKSEWEEALAQLVATTAQYQKDIMASIQSLIDQASQIATLLVSPSSPGKDSEEQEEEIVLE